MIQARIDELMARIMRLRPQTSLRRRILFGNALLALLLLVAGGIVVVQVERLVSAVQTLEEARVHVDAAVNIRQETTDLLATVTRLLPDEDADAFSSEVSARLEALRASQQELLVITEGVETGGVDDTATLEALEDVNLQVTNVTNIADTMVRQAEAEQWHSVVIRVGLLNRDQQQVLGAVDTLLQRVQFLEEEALAQVAAAEEAVVIYPTIVLAITLILAITLVFRISNSVTQPVEQLTESAAHLAAGHFERRVPEVSEDEIGQLARTFNSMADELQRLYENLEERVAERTRALETGLRVSRRLSTILDEKTLTQEVVDQIREAFDYYHVHIYLYDVERNHLLMVGGTGEAGRRMLLRGHRLQAGEGLVGRAAARNEVTLVEDVRREPDWLPNPLLPDTKSEIAVPIAFGDTVQGVLDVQHNVVGELDNSDADLLQLIAAQVAVALQNAQLLGQVRTRADRAARINAISQRIQSASSIEQVLEAAVQELGRVLPVNSALIELETPRFRPQTSVGKGDADHNGADNGSA